MNGHRLKLHGPALMLILHAEPTKASTKKEFKLSNEALPALVGLQRAWARAQRPWHEDGLILPTICNSKT